MTLHVYLRVFDEFKEWGYRNTGDLWIILDWNYDEEITYEYKGYILEITLMMLHQELYCKKPNEFPKNIYDSINRKMKILEEYLFPEWKETRPVYLDSQFTTAKHYIQGWKKQYEKMSKCC